MPNYSEGQFLNSMDVNHWACVSESGEILYEGKLDGVTPVKCFGQRIVKSVGGDPGFCRHYYRCVFRNTLYALQEEYEGLSVWYVCTEDEEPSHSLNVDFFDIDTGNLIAS